MGSTSLSVSFITWCDPVHLPVSFVLDRFPHIIRHLLKHANVNVSIEQVCVNTPMLSVTNVFVSSFQETNVLALLTWVASEQRQLLANLLLNTLLTCIASGQRVCYLPWECIGVAHLSCKWATPMLAILLCEHVAHLKCKWATCSLHLQGAKFFNFLACTLVSWMN